MLESMLGYLAEMPSLHKALWLAACLSLASLAEFVIPFVRAVENRWAHARTNLFFLCTTLVINTLFSLLLVNLIEFFAANKIGLFYWLNLPIWAELVLTLLALDLIAQYYVHYLLHNVSWMWRFHMVHHSDTHVNAFTGTRHHPVDYLFRELFSIATVALLGVGIGFYIFYRLVTILCTYFTHANIQLPDSLDKAISYVLVTPKAHKFHHHYQAPWTDLNYGNIFVFWDKLFGTYVYDDSSKIHYGVDVMDASQANSIKYQLTHPMRRDIVVSVSS